MGKKAWISGEEWPMRRWMSKREMPGSLGVEGRRERGERGLAGGSSAEGRTKSEGRREAKEGVYGGRAERWSDYPGKQPVQVRVTGAACLPSGPIGV